MYVLHMYIPKQNTYSPAQEEDGDLDFEGNLSESVIIIHSIFTLVDPHFISLGMFYPSF